jgi:hypothetical protein
MPNFPGFPRERILSEHEIRCANIRDVSRKLNEILAAPLGDDSFAKLKECAKVLEENTVHESDAELEAFHISQGEKADLPGHE